MLSYAEFDKIKVKTRVIEEVRVASLVGTLRAMQESAARAHFSGQESGEVAAKIAADEERLLRHQISEVRRVLGILEKEMATVEEILEPVR